MSVIILPTMNTKSVPKPSKGDVFGVLWATKNIDLTTKPGSFLLTDCLGEVYNSGDDSDLEIPVAFIRTNADQTDRFWCLAQKNGVDRADGLLFKTAGTQAQTGWAQDAISGTPTDACDNMVIFGSANNYDRLIVARDTDLAMLNNGVWDDDFWTDTLGQSALSNSHTHHLGVFLNKLLVPDGNVVHTVDDSLVAVINRLEFPDEYTVRWINNDGVYVYFGCEHIRGGDGLVFYWDGTSETYNGYYRVDSYTTLAGAPDKSGIMHVVNGNGQLMANTASGFEEVARFPWEGTFSQFGTIIADANLGDINTTIMPNGIANINGKISLLARVNPQTDYRSPEELPSGVWEYDPKIGLYMKHALSKQECGGVINSKGACSVSKVGALYKFNDYEDTGNQRQEFLCGAEIYTDASSTQKMIIKSNSSTSNRGYFITARLENGSDFRAFWQRLNLAYRKFSDSADRIIVKYKIDRRSDVSDSHQDDYVFTATWSDVYTFAINDSDGSKLAVGDEVEVIAGKSEGYTSHITSITNPSADNYTIVIDDNAKVSTNDTSKVRIIRWTKLGEVDDQTTEHKLMSIIKRSKWIQLKVELRGTSYSPQLEELFIEFNTSRR